MHESRSEVRYNGDSVAHYHLSEAQFLDIIEEHINEGGDNGDALKVLVTFSFL